MIRLLFLFFLLSLNVFGQSQVWLTDFNKNVYFEESPKTSFFIDSIQNLEQVNLGKVPTIFIKTNKKYQEIDGFGFTLTGASALLLNKIEKNKRSILLQELFGNKNKQIGISYLRIGVAATDLSSNVYSYNDLKEPESKDLELKNFNLKIKKISFLY
jgi:glucosylceramidase